MGLRVLSGVDSIFANNRSRNLQEATAENYEKLAAGERITRAAHDPAGLAISETLNASVRSYGRAIRNSNDGVSLAQTGEGYLTEMSNFAARMKELAIQAASDTVGDEQRGYINLEIQSIKAEIEKIAKSANYNNIRLFDGQGADLEFQIGIRNRVGEDRAVYDKKAMNLTLDNLGVKNLSTNTKTEAQMAIDGANRIIETVSDRRTVLGALQNKMAKAASVGETHHDNMTAGKSRIKDLDFAEGAAAEAVYKIRSQANVATMAQANSQSQAVLKLV